MRVAVIAVLLLLTVLAVAVHEVPMRHHKRSPREAQLLLEYMNRGPFAERINKILSKIFPSTLTPNIYAYPEVKIINYLDAQYYGYSLSNLVKSRSALLPKSSLWSSTLAPLTYGCPPKSADSVPLATFINTSIPPKVQPMSVMGHISTSPMAQVLSLDLSARTPLGWLDCLLRNLFSLRSPPFMVSVSWLPNSMVFWVWPGLPSPSTAFLSFSTY